MTRNQINIEYDNFFGNGLWERDYKPHITVFAEKCVRKSEGSELWIDSDDRLPEIGDRLLVKTTMGEKFYAVYTDHDEFEVNQPTDMNSHKRAWFKYTKRTVLQWMFLS